MNLPYTPLKNEIRMIATFKGLTLSRKFLLCSTAISMLYSYPHHYPVSAIYIFFFSLLCPTAMEQILFRRQTKEFTMQLSCLSRQQHFSYRRRTHLLWTFRLCNLLLVAWFYASLVHPTPDTFFNLLPGILLIIHLLIYLITSYYYRFQFDYQLKNNRW